MSEHLCKVCGKPGHNSLPDGPWLMCDPDDVPSLILKRRQRPSLAFNLQAAVSKMRDEFEVAWYMMVEPLADGTYRATVVVDADPEPVPTSAIDEVATVALSEAFGELGVGVRDENDRWVIPPTLHDTRIPERPHE